MTEWPEDWRQDSKLELLEFYDYCQKMRNKDTKGRASLGDLRPDIDQLLASDDLPSLKAKS